MTLADAAVPPAAVRACWLPGQIWRELELDRFRAARLPTNRNRTGREQIVQVLLYRRPMAPGSDWELHREWFSRSAMAHLLDSDFGLAEAHKL